MNSILEQSERKLLYVKTLSEHMPGETEENLTEISGIWDQGSKEMFLQGRSPSHSAVVFRF
jgi:hypothetical protein